MPSKAILKCEGCNYTSSKTNVNRHVKIKLLEAKNTTLDNDNNDNNDNNEDSEDSNRENEDNEECTDDSEEDNESDDD